MSVGKRRCAFDGDDAQKPLKGVKKGNRYVELGQLGSGMCSRPCGRRYFG